MALTKEQKKKTLEVLKDKINRQRSITCIGFSGTGVKVFTELRRTLKEQEGEILVAKKTLIKLALKEKYPDMATELGNIHGEIALAFGFKDALMPIKSVYKMSTKKKSIRILAGMFDNKFVTKEEVIALAQLPSREELFVKLMGTISAPSRNLVSVLQGNLRDLISIFNQVTLRNL